MTARRVVMLVAVFALALAVQAEAGGRRGHMKGHMGGGGGAKAALELSEDQLAQLDALKAQHMEEKQALRDEHKQAFEAILTADQLATLEAFRASRTEEGHHRRGARPDLGLSEEQQAELTALREQHHEVRQAQREQFKTAFEAILTPEQLATLEEIRASRPCHKGETDEPTGDVDDGGDSVTTAAAVQLDLGDDGAPTAVEDMSWGRVKEQLGR
jgi:Spy/CpxP family protein refolding chaperone